MARANAGHEERGPWPGQGPESSELSEGRLGPRARIPLRLQARSSSGQVAPLTKASHVMANCVSAGSCILAPNALKSKHAAGTNVRHTRLVHGKKRLQDTLSAGLSRQCTRQLDSTSSCKHRTCRGAGKPEEQLVLITGRDQRW